jgi:hypothetical protein
VKECFEHGFSLVIEKPGRYMFGSLAFDVSLYKERYEPRSFTEESQSSTEVLINLSSPLCSSIQTRFRAVLPLVVRRSFRDDFIIIGGRKKTPRNLAKEWRGLLSAVDRIGTAAFFGKEGLLAQREELEKEQFDKRVD